MPFAQLKSRAVTCSVKGAVERMICVYAGCPSRLIGSYGVSLNQLRLATGQVKVYLRKNVDTMREYCISNTCNLDITAKTV